MQQQSDSSSAEGLKELSALVLERYPIEAQHAVFPAGDTSSVE